MKNCHICGENYEDNYRFCLNCGCSLRSIQNDSYSDINDINVDENLKPLPDTPKTNTPAIYSLEKHTSNDKQKNTSPTLDAYGNDEEDEETDCWFSKFNADDNRDNNDNNVDENHESENICAQRVELQNIISKFKKTQDEDSEDEYEDSEDEYEDNEDEYDEDDDDEEYDDEEYEDEDDDQEDCDLCLECGEPLRDFDKFCCACGAKRPPENKSIHFSLEFIDMNDPNGFESHPLDDGENIVGIDNYPQLSKSPYISPKHTSLICENNAVKIRDLNSLNGTYYRIQSDTVLLKNNMIFRLGEHIFLFHEGDSKQTYNHQNTQNNDGVQFLGSAESKGWGYLAVLLGKDQNGNYIEGCVYRLNDEITIGRNRGSIIIDDGFISSIHAKLYLNQNNQPCLQDLGSSNGTFIRILDEKVISDSTYLLIADKLLMVRKNVTKHESA